MMLICMNFLNLFSDIFHVLCLSPGGTACETNLTCESAAKEGKLREKDIIKQVERNKQTAEKERKKLDRELQKEKIRSVSVEFHRW